MLSEKYAKKPLMPLNFKKLACSKGVRNFLCDWLFHDGLVLSYAPSNEFAKRGGFQFYLGGWVVEFKPDIERYCPVKPLYKVNFRVIRQLYEAGVLEVRLDLKRPHPRFILFTWSKEALAERREILRRYIIGSDGLVTAAKLDAVASVYGLKANYIPSRSAFEICKADGSHIPKGKTPRTWIFSNEAGEPVSKLNDMKLAEWEDVLYHVAKRIGILGRIGQKPEGEVGHFSRFKHK